VWLLHESLEMFKPGSADGIINGSIVAAQRHFYCCYMPKSEEIIIEIE
jgi:hypothetical protein